MNKGDSKQCASCQHCLVCGGAGYCALKLPQGSANASQRRAARIGIHDKACSQWQEDDLLGGDAKPLETQKPTISEVCLNNQISTNGDGTYRHWSQLEIATLYEYPQASAKELAEMLGRTTSQVEYARRTYGRYAVPGSVRLCQKCGQHLVNLQDKQAKRWGLCVECAIKEKDWRDREKDNLRRLNDARRQRKCKQKKRERRGKQDL